MRGGLVRGQAADAAERQRPAVHGHQWWRQESVRLSDRRREPDGVHFDQRSSRSEWHAASTNADLTNCVMTVTPNWGGLMARSTTAP